MALTLPPPPLQTPIVETQSGYGRILGAMTRQFSDWLQTVTTRVQTVSAVVTTLTLTAQSASLALTALIPLANGVYRVSYTARVTQAASTSSSLLVTVTTTTGAVTCTQASAAFTGNVTNTPISGSFLVKTDVSVPISVSTTYASVGATPMQYDLAVVVEQLT